MDGGAGAFRAESKQVREAAAAVGEAGVDGDRRGRQAELGPHQAGAVGAEEAVAEADRPDAGIKIGVGDQIAALRRGRRALLAALHGEKAVAAERREHLVGEPALELLGFRFPRGEDQAENTGLRDDDQLLTAPKGITSS